MIHNHNNREFTNRRHLYKNGKRKECGKCHKIKPYSEFYSKKDGLRSICKECNKLSVAIESFKNKLLIFTNIYNGKFDGKCSNCDVDISFLPIIDFHHKDRKLKQINWRHNRFKYWKEVMLTFEKEGVVPLCRNCHSLQNAKNFIDFKEIILKKDLFEYSAERIHQIIDNYVKQRVNKYAKNFKFRVVEWVKKRFVIENLYNGKCIGCGKINVYNNLPALEFHHITKVDNNNKLRWAKIKKYEIKEILNMLIRQNCVCLCSNCHTLIHSIQFKNIVDEILEINYSNKFKSFYKELLRNINNFKLQSVDVKDPLHILFKQGEAWKKYILQIHIINLNEGTNMILPLKLMNNLEISKRHLNRVIDNLKKRDLIKIIKNGEKQFLRLTDNTNKRIKNILQDSRYVHYLEQNLKKKV
ncbi:MAG: hypothetical protein ACFE8L_14830 [Candidatus Hodarchaeota archaeon]